MISDVWHFLNTIGAFLGVGAVVVVLLMLFAPSVVTLVVEYLKSLAPLVRGLADGIVWFARTMWEGFKDMTDNAASIVYVIVLMLLAGWWAHSHKECPVPKCKAAVSTTQKPVASWSQRVKSKFSPRSKPVAAPKPKPKTDPTPGQMMRW